MSFVAQVPETEAPSNLKAVYQRIRDDFGFVPNYFQALGTMPEVVSSQRVLLQTIMGDGALPRAVKEKIIMVVSGINSSSYCIAAHMEILQGFKVEKALSRKLATHYPGAPVDPKEMALYRFADMLTRNAADIQKSDADMVLEAGWSEAALIETVLTAAWANFINRVAFGLGLVADF